MPLFICIYIYAPQSSLECHVLMKNKSSNIGFINIHYSSCNFFLIFSGEQHLGKGELVVLVVRQVYRKWDARYVCNVFFVDAVVA